MIFNSLTITNLNTKKVYNYYKFNTEGLNLILGQKSLENDETNGVGKTALVECIRYCLGSSLPLCFKNKSALFQNAIFVILELKCKDKVLKIGRYLYDDSFAYISDSQEINYSLSFWEPYTKDNFKTYIQSTMYDNMAIDSITTPPSFPSVQEYLMRDEKIGFHGVGHGNRSATSVNQIISFLSLIPSYFESNLNSQKKIIKDLQNELSIIKEIGKEIKQIRDLHIQTIDEINDLKKMLDNADVSTKITYDEKKYYELKENISMTQQKIHQLEFAKSQHEKNIRGLEENLKKAKDLINLKDFYDNTLKYFPENIMKDYIQIEKFYNFMVENRGAYFRKQIETIKESLQPLYSKYQEYLKELSKCTEFVKNSNLVIDLREISNQITIKYKKIAEYEYKIEKYKLKKSIEDKIKKQKSILEEMAEKYEKRFNDFNSNISNIIEHFYKLNEVAYGERGELIYSFEKNTQTRANTGRVKIACSIPDEGAHGRFLMKINMFDIALLLNRVDRNSGLLFLCHDGSYSKPTPSIKGSMLLYIDDYLKNSKKGQYFMTINTEELTEKDLAFLRSKGSIIAELERTDDNRKRSIGIKY